MIDDHLNRHKILNLCQHDHTSFLKTLAEALRGGGVGGGGSHVAHLNFKTSHVGVYKCLLLKLLLQFG